MSGRFHCHVIPKYVLVLVAVLGSMNLLLLNILFRIVIVVLVILMIAFLFGLVHVVKGICVYWSLSTFLPPSRFCVGRKRNCLR